MTNQNPLRPLTPPTTACPLTPLIAFHFRYRVANRPSADSSLASATQRRAKSEEVTSCFLLPASRFLLPPAGLHRTRQQQQFDSLKSGMAVERLSGSASMKDAIYRFLLNLYSAAGASAALSLQLAPLSPTTCVNKRQHSYVLDEA